MSGEGLLIADVGTGSGCIAIALAKELPEANLYALDISHAALAVARRNAARLGLSNRITFLESNLLESLSVVGAQHATPLPGKESATQRARKSRTSDDESPVTSHQSPLFDLIVSNPPYIGRHEAATLAREVRDHEPVIALFGGEEGYELYADLITQSASNLKPGGILVLELGHDSRLAVQPLFDSPAWTNVGVTNDLASIPRVIAAEKA
jgi:release factor glutamine methyltransferase